MSENKQRDFAIIGVLVLVVILAYVVLADPFNDPLQAKTQQPTPTSHQDAMSVMESMSGFPETFEELVPMGNELMDNGNYPMAAECYRRALEIHEDLNVRVDFGACLHGMGLPDRAMEEFYDVIEKDPGHTIALFNLGIVYSTEGQIDSAKAYFGQYLELDPNGAASATAKRLLNEL